MSQEKDFILYAIYNSYDAKEVSNLAHDLLEYEITCILQPNTPESNRDLGIHSNKGITDADGVLVFITRETLSETFVDNTAKTLAMVSKTGKLILPVIYDDIEVPAFIRRYQAILAKGVYSGKLIHDIVEAVNHFSGGKRDRYQVQNEQSNVSSAYSDLPNYWLVQLNPNTWKIEDFKIGDNAFFNTHYYSQKRPEYEMFMQIRQGDRILGFATGSYHCIVCEMEVSKPVGPDTAQGEGFEMVIRKLIHPRISITHFSHLIPDILPKLNQTKEPPELFFRLTEDIYQSILKPGDEVDKRSEYLYQPFFLTEGKHANTIDQLDFENDIASFASVITLEKVHPPLAIGLFGNWGSGKSFFMEKLSESIKKICAEKEEGTIRNVVEVKFNSWHYSDTNLWASLVTRIFEGLHEYAINKPKGAEEFKAIYQQLDITNQHLGETQKKLETVTGQVSDLEAQQTKITETIKEKEKILTTWTPGKLVEAVLSDPFIQRDFKNIKEKFKDKKLSDNIEKIDDRLSEIDTARGQIVESFVLLRKNQKGNWKWIWILAGLIAVCIWLVLGPLKEQIQKFISQGVVITGLVLAWISNVVVRLSPHFNKINQFYRRLKSLKQTIDTERQNVKLKEPDELVRLREEINSLTAAKKALEEEQTATAERKAKLENEINDIGSGKLIANFLASRSADDVYIKQLGIISWVRNDFDTLDKLFKNQKAARENKKKQQKGEQLPPEQGQAGPQIELPPELQIDRIVLYIDDLDRCNEDVVVKVLEAIHLLMTFELFVVVVGVDPRWLNNALSVKYKNLFGKINKKKKKDADVLLPSEEDLSALTGVATSYDYLEKIFQIPFALKPINKPGRDKLIKYLIKDEMAVEKMVVDTHVNSAGAPGSGDTGTTTGSPGSDTKKKPDDTTKTDTNRDKAKKAKEKLVFTKAELEYMQQMSPLFGQTPRTINRYVNIYRIIKAHGNLKMVGDFSKEEFMPILFMLGIIVGCSPLAEEFIDQIAKAQEGDTFKSFINKSNFPEKLKKLIEPVMTDIENLTMKNFQRNIELIARFSFRTLLKEA